ncbi:MAG: radical SAM protein [Archaeoglobales archaeon]|nr:radical SAM protein [Archaeoglobales archaeon]
MEFDEILKKVIETPTVENCLALIEKVNNYERIRQLFDVASEIRDENLDRVLKLDGFIYPVKKCQMEHYCIYCSNYVEKFRVDALNLDEFIKAVDFIKDCGMKRVTLEGGYNSEVGNIPDFVRIARRAGLDTALDVYPIKMEDLRIFKTLGVSEIYASIEIADKDLFSHFKPSESFEARLNLAKWICKEKIWLSSTLLIGLPKTDYEVWVKGLFMLREMPYLRHCSISGFQPVYGTPLQNCDPVSPIKVAKIVALARILLPDKDISAGGSVGDLHSLPLMLMAGANRAYLGAYVCRTRTQRGFADEFDEVFKSDYEVKIVDRLVFANPLPAVEKICREFGFEID